MKIAWHCHKNWQVDQSNLIEDPVINTHTYENLIFEKEEKIYNEMENNFKKQC